MKQVRSRVSNVRDTLPVARRRVGSCRFFLGSERGRFGTWMSFSRMSGVDWIRSGWSQARRLALTTVERCVGG
jgi:hypothetical protein